MVELGGRNDGSDVRRRGNAGREVGGPPMWQRVSKSIAVTSLVLAAAAYYPSAAAFTPAIVLSFVAAGGALVTACLGFVRLAIVTLLAVAATVLISPLFFPSFSEPDAVPLMLGSVVVVMLVGFVLLWDFRARGAGA
jgi:hypothetical protein